MRPRPGLIVVVLVPLLLGSAQPNPVLSLGEAPLVGFSFSPQLVDAPRAPANGLRELLWKLNPDLVRLPIYWSQVAPQPDLLDFSQVDALLATVAKYDAARPSHKTAVVLVVGARNLATPELHLPDWWASAGPVDLGLVTSSAAYFNYLKASFDRYAGSPLLYAWQVENEPLDNTNSGLGDVTIQRNAIAAEVQQLKRIDPRHPVVVTTYNSSNVALDKEATSRLSWLYQLLPGPHPAGHPQPALDLGDVLGLDIYVVTPSTPLAQTGVSQRIDWKAAALDYWLQRAHGDSKQVWITEMQAAPWDGQDGFTIEDLQESAQAYSRTGVGVVLLWGVESWLGSADWMAAGRQAMTTIRAG